MSPVSRGRKPDKNPKPPRRAPSPPPRWAVELEEPAEFSRCVLQSVPDKDSVTLVARMAHAGRTLGVEVVVAERSVRTIKVFPVAGQAGALLRRTKASLAEAPLTAAGFRAQAEAALAVRDDKDAWFAWRVPGFAEKYPAQDDYPVLGPLLRSWLGVPPYEPVPRLAEAEQVLDVVVPALPPGPATGFQLAVALEKPAAPVIWRRLEVRSDVTLAALHRIIAVVFDRDEKAAHRFETAYGAFSSPDHIDDGRADSAVTLAQVVPGPGNRFTCGTDTWDYRIRLERVLDAPPALPRCTDGGRASPPPECPSADDYEFILEALADPEEEENEHALAEYGLDGGFDPRSFEPDEAGEDLARLS